MKMNQDQQKAAEIRSRFLDRRFEKATLDFTDMNLDDVDFTSLRLDGSGEVSDNCNFNGCSFKNSLVGGIGFRNSDFRNSDLRGTYFLTTTLYKCDFRGANLFGSTLITCNLNSANLSGLDLTYTTIVPQMLCHASLEESTLTRIIWTTGSGINNNWCKAKISESTFSNIDLSGSLFNNAKLSLCNFLNTRCLGVSFNNANLRFCTFDKAHLNGTSFDGSKLEHVKLFNIDADSIDLSKALLEKIEVDEETFNKIKINDSQRHEIKIIQSEKEATPTSNALANTAMQLRSRHVLILGKDYGDELQLLREIRLYLKNMGYVGIIAKEQPDIPEESNEGKVRILASLCKFVIIENSFAGGHLFEVTKVCAANRIITAMIRQRGKGSSWMTTDSDVDYAFMYEIEYESNSLSIAVRDAVTWAENKIKDRIQSYNKKYPWR